MDERYQRAVHRSIQDSDLESQYLIGKIWRYLQAEAVPKTLEEIQLALGSGRCSTALVLKRLQNHGRVYKHLKGRYRCGPTAIYSLQPHPNMAELAAQGHSTLQIGEKLGWHPDSVLRKAKEIGVRIPRDRKPKVKPERIVRSLIDSLDCLIPSDELMTYASQQEIDPLLVKDLERAFREAFRKMRKAMQSLQRGE